jgi:hypothetical protein
MGLSGEVFAVPPHVAAEWWKVCSDPTLSVEIIPSLEIKVPVEWDGYGYRRGVVTRGTQSIAVVSSPGRRNSEHTACVGSSFLVLSPRNPRPHHDDSLLEYVGQVLMQSGSTPVQARDTQPHHAPDERQ